MHACAFGVDVDNSPLTCDSKPHLRYYTKNANLLLWTNHQNGRSIAATTGSWTRYHYRYVCKHLELSHSKMSYGNSLDCEQTLKCLSLFYFCPTTINHMVILMLVFSIWLGVVRLRPSECLKMMYTRISFKGQLKLTVIKKVRSFLTFVCDVVWSSWIFLTMR